MTLGLLVALEKRGQTHTQDSCFISKSLWSRVERKSPAMTTQLSRTMFKPKKNTTLSSTVDIISMGSSIDVYKTGYMWVWVCG